MDDTQTTSPATDDIATAQTPTSEHAPSGPAQAPGVPADAPSEAPSGSPGFSERGRMRRRMRFLRKARELAYRDLGGLVFDLHRFARRNDALVLAKLETIGRIDTELRALEATLAERRPVTVLREAGVAACPRCAAIHGSDDRFCPNCGLAMDLRAERPVAGPQSAVQTPTTAPTPAPAPTPVPAPTPPQPVPASTAMPAPASARAPGATPAPAAAPAATPAPASTPAATPAPAPAPAPTPAPTSAPAPPPAPPPVTSAPAGPAPAVDQPTEIIRPPSQDP
jgi:hypothetical protein